jgi:hypothetical protein
MQYHQGIRIDSIPVNGIPGFLFVGTTLVMFPGSIPAVREFLLVTGPAGIIWSGVLYHWRNQTRW